MPNLAPQGMPEELFYALVFAGLAALSLFPDLLAWIDRIRAYRHQKRYLRRAKWGTRAPWGSSR